MDNTSFILKLIRYSSTVLYIPTHQFFVRYPRLPFSISLKVWKICTVNYVYAIIFSTGSSTHYGLEMTDRPCFIRRKRTIEVWLLPKLMLDVVLFYWHKWNNIHINSRKVVISSTSLLISWLRTLYFIARSHWIYTILSKLRFFF